MPSVKIEKQQLASNYRENAFEDSNWNLTRNIFYIDVSDLRHKEARIFIDGVQATLKAMEESGNT